MGKTINHLLLDKENIKQLMYPVIFCVDRKAIMSYIEGYHLFSLNAILSQSLFRYKIEERKEYVWSELDKIMNKTEPQILVTDFEMLFNPEYKIDVIKYFIALSRKRKVAVHWCGSYENGYLYFAEPRYVDYRAYCIEKYDISCII